MQKFIVLLSLVLSCAAVHAQSLTFSRVLLIKPADGNVYVPANTVWKVESVIPNIGFDNATVVTSSGAACSPGNFRNSAIDINGTPTKIGPGMVPTSYSNQTYANSSATLPIWLPAGTYIGTPCPLVSVIEFNIVP